MNWKQEAMDKLKGYEAHKRALENIPEEIKRLESQSVSIQSSVKAGEPIRGGGGDREDRMLSNMVHREELERTLEQTKSWVRMVERGLSAMDDEERLVLNRLYIHQEKGAVNRLCEELGLQEESSVYRRKDKALRRFTLALYGCLES